MCPSFSVYKRDRQPKRDFKILISEFVTYCIVRLEQNFFFFNDVCYLEECTWTEHLSGSLEMGLQRYGSILEAAGESLSRTGRLSQLQRGQQEEGETQFYLYFIAKSVSSQKCSWDSNKEMDDNIILNNQRWKKLQKKRNADFKAITSECMKLCYYGNQILSVDVYKMQRWLCLLTMLGIMSKSYQVSAARQVFKTLATQLQKVN